MADPKLLNRLGAKLGELLTDTSETGNAASAGQPTSPQAGRQVLQDEFESHLRSLIKDDAKPLAGRVNFIGLSKIRDKLGDRWPKLAERADDITRKAIERRLIEADVYTKYKELHYLIIFAQLTHEQAQLKCALIAEEITKKLLGDDITPELLEVKTMVSQLEGKFEFEDVPDIEALAAKLGEAPAPAAEAKEDSWWEDDETSDPLAKVQLVYRPMWDVKRNAVTTFVCAPALPGPAGRLLVGEAEIPRLDQPAVALRLDQLVQKRVIGDLRKLVEAGQQQLLCLPVHFETLAVNQRRMAYIERCQRGIPPLGIKLLVFELTGVPDGIPQNRLFELATSLKRFSRGVLLRTTLAQPWFRPPAETGISAMGIEHHAGSAVPEAKLIGDMERFATGAKKAGLATYVHGLRTISLTTAAIAAGFDFVDGDIVTSVVEQPRGAYAYQMQDLYTARLR
jgi:hypothetical protein